MVTRYRLGRCITYASADTKPDSGSYTKPDAVTDRKSDTGTHTSPDAALRASCVGGTAGEMHPSW